jgi:hypothetical protein
VKKAWEALHFIIPIFKKGNSSTKREIFLCEQDHPALEPVACGNSRGSPCKPNAFRKRVRKVINVVN